MSTSNDMPSDEEVRIAIADWETRDPEIVRMFREDARARERDFFEMMRRAMRAARIWEERVRHLDSAAREELRRAEFEELKARVLNRIEIDRARFETLKNKADRTEEEEEELFQLNLQFGSP